MDENAPGIGSIGWIDLTVPDATGVRDFYRDVVGWEATGVDMGEYADFCVHPPGDPDNVVAGICHARGDNATQPPLWMIYITVGDLERSVTRCRELGGTVLVGPRPLGEGVFAVIRDPAGAVAGLYQK